MDGERLKHCVGSYRRGDVSRNILTVSEANNVEGINA